MVVFKHNFTCAITCDLERRCETPQDFCKVQPVPPVRALQCLGCPDLLWALMEQLRPSIRVNQPQEELDAFGSVLHGFVCAGNPELHSCLESIWAITNFCSSCTAHTTSSLHSQALSSHLSSSDLSSKSPFYPQHLPSAACLEHNPGFFLPQKDRQE